MVCFTHPRLAGPRLSALLARIYEQGEVWISETRLRGSVPALRACITSYRTQVEDVAYLVDVLQTTLGQLTPERS